MKLTTFTFIFFCNLLTQIDVSLDNKFSEKTKEGLIGETFDKVITLFHETFIHADLDTKDYLDNKMFDNSNISGATKTAANNLTYHFQHYKVLMDYQKNGYNTINMWPGNAFFGIKELDSKLKIYNNDQNIIIKMWNYSGGVELDANGNQKK